MAEPYDTIKVEVLLEDVFGSAVHLGLSSDLFCKAKLKGVFLSRLPFQNAMSRAFNQDLSLCFSISVVKNHHWALLLTRVNLKGKSVLTTGFLFDLGLLVLCVVTDGGERSHKLVKKNKQLGTYGIYI